MVANILIALALFFIVAGLIGILRFKSLMLKLLTSSLIDTMAMMLLIFGLILKTGFNGIGIRLIVIWLFLLLTTPVINHMLTQAAHFSEGEKHD
ncbi:MAG: monovalent cation/H(+) antiporter subunit G [Clostridia bacterium]|nr:monovalent cation/H(+) antiporter subunit G [Clostridia bacterium]